ncbi:MAG: histidinol-phosphate transaminase [Candidatus Sumerlaeia bacterium]|nr:histidinol-phosphate transaminase [Candidatus Sumerlaeia bacterium]
MSNIFPKLNERIINLTPYVPGEQPREQGFIKLNTNENPYPPSPTVIKALKRVLREKVRLYPDPESLEVRRIAGQRWGLAPEQIFVGNGSDEVLRLIFQCYLCAGDSVGSIYPTYILYETLANLFGAKTVFYELNPDLSLPEQFTRRLPHKIICIANPNPPYGTLYEIEQIADICRKNPASIVLIDEAYIDFAKNNALSLLDEFKNIIITRSFSKSYGMAGLRIGFALAQPEIIANFYKAKDSYNVNALAQVAAITALKDNNYYRHNIQKILAGRRWLTDRLNKLGFSIPPSEANFIFAQWHGNARWIYEELKKRKILVRFFNHPRLANGLRISIGTMKENKILVSALKEILKYEKKKSK